MKFLNKGFTLVELMVVISIMAVLSSITLVAVSSTRQTARDGYRLAQIRQIKTALELYYSAHGYYPYEGAAAYDLTDYKIPMYWTEMIRDLNDENFIKATLANDDIDKGTKFLTLINKLVAIPRQKNNGMLRLNVLRMSLFEKRLNERARLCVVLAKFGVVLIPVKLN
jgi:prepilin-type N-terminal cleavage/methylation domain-containing protein